MSPHCGCILSEKDPLWAYNCIMTKSNLAAKIDKVSVFFIDGLTCRKLMTSLTQMMFLLLFLLLMKFMTFVMFVLVPTICKRISELGILGIFLSNLSNYKNCRKEVEPNQVSTTLEFHK